MTNEQTLNGLSQLGFESGWIVVDNEITVWENTKAKPTKAQIAAAATLWEQNKANQEAEAVAAKEVALAKLAALGLDLDDLKSLGF